MASDALKASTVEVCGICSGGGGGCCERLHVKIVSGESCIQMH